MHLAKMWNQDGHLLRHGTTCEEQASHVRNEAAFFFHAAHHAKVFIMNRKPTSGGEDLEGEEEFYYTELEVPLNDFAVFLVGNNGTNAVAGARLK